MEHSVHAYTYMMKGGGLKTRDWKTSWDQIAGVEKTGLENTRPKRMGGNRRKGKHGTKFLGVEKAGLVNAGTSCAWVTKCNCRNTACRNSADPPNMLCIGVYSTAKTIYILG